MEIKSAHSDEDIRHELAYMVYGGGIGITLEKAMRLYLMGSHLIHGGVYDDEEAERVSAMFADEKEWLAALDEINAAFRALEIIDNGGGRQAPSSDYETFSPEWLATVAATAAVMANDTIARIMTDYSLVTVFHLVAASHRRNGGTTHRPLDRDSVLAALKEASNG